MDIEKIKKQFPVFTKYPDLVYLDNAATTQRPQMVIDALNDFHISSNANIHRGVYDLSAKSTRSYENARKTLSDFLNASSPESIAFTKGTTESINIIASSFLQDRLKPGDNIVVSIMEHHANFIPWQMVCQTCEAELRVVSITSDGDLDKTELRKLVDERTKLVAITHISNTLGTVNDLDEIIGIAHQVNAPVMIDAAQSAALYSLDVQALDCDFLTFSAHKAFGPFGIGILYAKPEHTKHIHPYNFGGGIVKMVSVGNTDFMPFPTCLEAGTPNISGAIGMAAGIDFIKTLDLEELRKHIHQLTSECRSALSAIDDVSVIGDPESYTGIVSFMVDDIHPHDVASFLNEDNIAVRAGMHCTQPLLSSLDVPATVRASFSIYNTMEDVDQLVVSVKELIKFWK